MPATSGNHPENVTTYKRATSLVEQVLSIRSALDEHGIAHAFGGALALAYHTKNPRTTSDIDINIALGVPKSSGGVPVPPSAGTVGNQTPENSRGTRRG